MPIHPTAIVDRHADVHESVDVGPYCVIEGNVRVHAGCTLYHGVYLTGWTDVGEHCVFHPGVIVGHAPQDLKYTGDRSYCRMGSRNVLREYVTVHRGTDAESTTEIGNDCYLLAGSHVGHNCMLANNVTLINNALLGGHVAVGDGVTVGGGAGVHQFVRIGQLAMIPGQARVTQDIVPFAMVGVEGRIAGLNRVGMRRAGMTPADAEEIRNAYRIIFQPGTTPKRTAAAVEQVVESSWGKVLVQFLRSDSRRGYAGRSRREA